MHVQSYPLMAEQGVIIRNSFLAQTSMLYFFCNCFSINSSLNSIILFYYFVAVIDTCPRDRMKLPHLAVLIKCRMAHAIFTYAMRSYGAYTQQLKRSPSLSLSLSVCCLPLSMNNINWNLALIFCIFTLIYCVLHFVFCAAAFSSNNCFKRPPLICGQAQLGEGNEINLGKTQNAKPTRPQNVKINTNVH